MTIIDTTPTQAADLTPAQEAVQGPEVRRISPHALVVEDNIRSQVDLDRAFVNSIKLHGVIVPILAHPDQDGNMGLPRVLLTVGVWGDQAASASL